MDPSSQNIISQDKLEQAALLYGLTDPFFEPQEALNFAKERNKYAKRAAKNNDNLRTLLVFADLFPSCGVKSPLILVVFGTGKELDKIVNHPEKEQAQRAKIYDAGAFLSLVKTVRAQVAKGYA